MATNKENDIDTLAENLDVSILGEALQYALRVSGAPSPTTLEPTSPVGSEETTKPGRTRRNTMAAQGEASASTTTAPELNPDQLRQIVTALSGGTRRPKAKEPEVYSGERHKLRGWLAQLVVYYKTVGWQNGHVEEKILYATSLLRDDAGTRITPYAEERITPTWNIWAGFKEEQQSQFDVIDAKGEARIKLKNTKQGKRLVTEYWNEFRLVASEAELDDSTGGELLLGGMSTELQNAWGASSDEYESTEFLAQWAIRKETKLATVRHIPGNPSTRSTNPRTNDTPRNQDGMFRPTTNNNASYGDPMDLDATKRRPRLNISRDEFQRRMREQLCLKCGRPGHRAAACDRKNEPRPFNPQAKNWQPTRKPAPWQTRPKIREMEVEKEPEQSGNDDCPQ